jgi:UDP-glucuronate decarboxylase
MLELAEKVIQLTNSRSQIVFRELPADDPQRRRPDITRAEQTLGWRPRVPLEEGLARTIEYFDGVLSGNSPAPASNVAKRGGD